MKLTTLIFALLVCSVTFSQSSEWKKTDLNEKAFVVNQSQFDSFLHSTHSEILFGARQKNVQYLLTKSGITYHFKNLNKIKQLELQELMREEEHEREKLIGMNEEELEKEMLKELEFEKKIKNYSVFDEETISMELIGANHNAQVLGESKLAHYYNYLLANSENEILTHVPAYSQVVYKNIYPNIDLTFQFHEEIGLKYAFIVHPGGNAADIKFKYSGVNGITLGDNGNLKVNTTTNGLIDHAPVSFYNKTDKMVRSYFQLNDNVVSFTLEDYDKSKTLIIDPWVKPTGLSGTDKGLHVKSDNFGNTYVFGGGYGPFSELKKFNSSGILQWTYSSGWNTNGWYGYLEVDKTDGHSYLTNGSGNIQRIDENGSLVWTKTYSSFLSGFVEVWALSFDCNFTTMMASGRPDLFSGSGFMLINPVNGDSVQPSSIPSIGNEEIRAIAPAPDGNFYHTSLVRNMAVCPNYDLIFEEDHNYNMDYWACSDYDGDGLPGALNAIAAGKDYFYTSNSDSLNKWNLDDGSYVQGIKIPGGIQHMGSGVLVDSCGNIYVGTNIGIFKYDSNLTYIDSINIPAGVYDLDFGPTGEILATGTGYVGVYDLNSCGKCACDASTITAAAPDTIICAGDSVQLWAKGGQSYTWSPNYNISNTNSANPTVYPDTTVTYIVEILIDSCHKAFQGVTVTVGGSVSVTPLNPSICQGDSVTLTASGGNSYNWSNGNSLSVDTGATVIAFPDTTTQYIITDTAGCTTSTTVLVHPTPTLSFFPPNTAICDGDSVTITASGAQSYSWSPNTYLTTDTGSVVTAFPPSATDIFVIGTDSNGCVVTDTISIGIGTPPNLNVIPDQNVCAGDSVLLYASGAFSYSWSPSLGLNSNTGDSVIATPIDTITYYVTGSDTAGCISTDSVTVTVLELPAVSLGPDTILCEGEQITLDAGNYQTYEWSSNQTIQTISVDLPGTYTVAVTDQNGCKGTDTIMVSYSVLELDLGPDQYKCSGESVLLDAGNGGANYLWSSGETTQQNYVADAGTYWVKIDDGGRCEKWDTVQVIKATSPYTQIISEKGYCDEVILAVDNKPENSFEWSSGENTHNIIVTESGQYWVQVFNGECYNSDTIDVVTEYIEPETFIPNVFTPNGDNFNDELDFILPETETYELKIYNRWGRLVFESDNPEKDWNGRDMPEGVYQYVLVYKKLCINKEVVKEVGYVSLLR